MALRTGEFGNLPDGAAVTIFTLDNRHGVEIRIMTLGGTVVSLRTPDRYGRLNDIVLGFDSVAEYLHDASFFGAIIGRYANRIAHGRFTLDGQQYQLATNHPPNHLHGGVRGFDRRLWDAEPIRDERGAAVVFSRTSPDGEEGYPGTLHARVACTLTDQNELIYEFQATTDRPTPVNLSEHSYFNLAGAGNGEILDHELTIFADAYTPVNATLIPTGIEPIAGTPFDFRTSARIGARIHQDDAQLRFGRGYDHNFVLRAAPPGLRAAAHVYEPHSGRSLDIHTTEPGLQLYSGNFPDAGLAGKGGRRYRRRAGFCLEPQHFPDSPNQPAFPSAILRPGAAYHSRTVLRFGVVT